MSAVRGNTTLKTPVIEVLADPERLAHRLADWLLEAARSVEPPFAVALSGGSSPRRLYELLAQSPRREAFPWDGTHWFWGDERFVSHDDPQSNYRMVHEAMLSHAPIPPGNIYAIPTEGMTPEAAVTTYERKLTSFYGAGRLDPKQPLFDVTLLGLGPDGHTASLFPNTAVLNERQRWVAAVIGAKPEIRITLTYPPLESSRHAVFLVTGKEKQSVLDRLRRGDWDLPAARLDPIGTLHYFADVAAWGEMP
jgi:6-phosphogluconolactonase